MKLISGNRITKLLNSYSCKFCMKKPNDVLLTGLQWSIFWFDIFWHSESSLTAHICVVFVYKSRRKISKKASLRKNVFIFFISRKPNFVFWAVQIEIFTEKLHRTFSTTLTNQNDLISLERQQDQPLGHQEGGIPEVPGEGGHPRAIDQIFGKGKNVLSSDPRFY